MAAISPKQWFQDDCRGGIAFLLRESRAMTAVPTVSPSFRDIFGALRKLWPPIKRSDLMEI
jgi:hypothetical protein